MPQGYVPYEKNLLPPGGNGDSRAWWRPWFGIWYTHHERSPLSNVRTAVGDPVRLVVLFHQGAHIVCLIMKKTAKSGSCLGGGGDTPKIYVVVYHTKNSGKPYATAAQLHAIKSRHTMHM